MVPMKSGESRGPLLYQDQTLGDDREQSWSLDIAYSQLSGKGISIPADCYGSYRLNGLTCRITFKARQMSGDQPGLEPSPVFCLL